MQVGNVFSHVCQCVCVCVCVSVSVCVCVCVQAITLEPRHIEVYLYNPNPNIFTMPRSSVIIKVSGQNQDHMRKMIILLISTC